MADAADSMNTLCSKGIGFLQRFVYRDMGLARQTAPDFIEADRDAKFTPEGFRARALVSAIISGSFHSEGLAAGQRRHYCLSLGVSGNTLKSQIDIVVFPSRAKIKPRRRRYCQSRSDHRRINSVCFVAYHKPDAPPLSLQFPTRRSSNF